MKCPNCGLINPDPAQRCDCGYDFQSRRIEGKQQAHDDSVVHYCSECGAKVSTNDKVCPKCGADVADLEDDNNMETITAENQRYKTLLAFGKFFSFIGWVVVVIGGIIFFVGLSQLGQRDLFGGSSSIGSMGLVTGLLVAIYGIMLVASGQGISCFVSIENNTHATMLAQQAILNIMHKSKAHETAAVVSGVAAKNLRPVKKTKEFAEKMEKTELSNTETEEDEELEFCYHCGTKLTEKTKKCPECGKTL